MITLSTMQSLNESVSYNPYDDIPIEDLGSVVESAIMNEGIGHDIWEGIKKIWGKIVAAVKTLINKIKNFFSGLFNKNKSNTEAVKAKIDKMPDDAAVKPAKTENDKIKFKVNTFFELKSPRCPLSDDVVNSIIAKVSGANPIRVKRATKEVAFVATKDNAEARQQIADDFKKISDVSIDMSSADILNAAGLYNVDGEWVLNCYKKLTVEPKTARDLKRIADNISNANLGEKKFLDDIVKCCNELDHDYTAMKDKVDNYAKEYADKQNLAKLCKAQAAACAKKLSLVTGLCGAYTNSVKRVSGWNIWMLSQYTNPIDSTLSSDEQNKLRLHNLKSSGYVLNMNNEPGPYSGIKDKK